MGRERRTETSGENRGAQARDADEPALQATFSGMESGAQAQEKARSERRSTREHTAVRSTKEASRNLGGNQSAQRIAYASPITRQLHPSADESNLDTRKYRIRYPGTGEYFEKWRATEWDTVKRTAVWTLDKAKALCLTLKEWEKENYIEIVCGFSNLSLEAG